MSDTPPKPVSQPSQNNKASDTSSNALEMTGSDPVPLSDSAGQATVVSNHPNAPHPAVAGEIPVIVGYNVIRKLGEGGMGAVFLAEDERLGRKVAIKTMKREYAANRLDRERFLREARIAAAVEHDNIVPIWGVGEAADGTPFIAMPFLQGEMLDARLKREHIIPPDFILKVAREVADGLVAAHEKGLIHRDIKPGNIWLEGEVNGNSQPVAAKAPLHGCSNSVRRCKILDFGLARSVDKEEAQLTASGAILGTPSYMAPEQARGEKVDVRADLFSLGATLYRMATGRLPFEGPTPMAVLISLTTETPPPVRQLAPELPQELADLIDRLMHKDRERRPRSAAEVAAMTRQIGDSLRDRNTTPQATARSRKPLLLVAAVACLLALVPLSLWLSGVISGTKPAPEVVKDEEPPKKEPEPEVKKDSEPKKQPEPKVEQPKQEPKVEQKNVEPKQEPKVEPKKNPEPKVEPNLNADRKAALWALTAPNADGTVFINDGDKIDEAKDLPKEPFRLTGVNILPKLNDNMKLLSAQNADLAVFKNCANITGVFLAGDGISNEGLTHFSNCKKLKGLYLSGTKVDDKAAAIIKQFTKLEDLTLGATEFTEKGVIEVAAGLPGCRIQYGYTIEPATEADRKAAEYVLSIKGKVRVNYDERDITDAKELPKELFRLTRLYLAFAQVADEGLENFKDCSNITEIYLTSTPVTNAGLANFSNYKHLTGLYLSGTKVTDAGLANLENCSNLKVLFLKDTKVTEKGVKDLAKALPECEIVWDNGAIKPKEK